MIEQIMAEKIHPKHQSKESQYNYAITISVDAEARIITRARDHNHYSKYLGNTVKPEQTTT